MATVQYFDGTDWLDLQKAEWKVDQAVSSAKVAPTATVRTGTDVITPNTQVRIRDTDGARTLFEGYARSRGQVEASGVRVITVDGYGTALMGEPVTFSFSAGDTDEQFLQTVLDNSERGSQFTLDFAPSPAAINGDTDIEDKSVSRLFRRICDIRNYVFWIDPSKTIHVEQPGGRGSLGSYTVGDDPIEITQFESGNVQTVRNRVVVRAKGGSGAVDSVTAEDQTSIGTYGVRPEDITSDWIASQQDAQDLADSLLAPNPQISGEVRARPSMLGSQYDSLVNYQLTLTDPRRDLDSTTVAITQQTLSESNDTIRFGGGSTSAVATSNRQTDSRESRGVVDLDDVPDSDSFAKILSSAVQDGVHLLSSAAGNLDDVPDGTTYARVNEGNVDSNNYVLLAASTGDLDDIDDGSDYARVLATGIDAGQVILAAATGDLDDIDDGSNFGKVDITNLTPGSAVFASGVEVEDGSGNLVRDVQSFMTDDATKAATVIDGGELLTGSITAGEIDANTITADEIDTLFLQSDELSVSDSDGNEILFDTFDDGFGNITIYLRGNGSTQIGSSGNPFGDIWGAFGRYEDLQTNTLAVGPESSVPGTDGETEFATSSTHSVFIEDRSVGPTIRPASDASGALGIGDGSTSTNAWQEIHTHNLYEYSPAPVASDASPGPNHIDLDDLKASSWEDPPAYVSQRKVVTERDDDGNPIATAHEPAPEGTVELGALSNYLLEVAKAQQERIEDLEDTVADLEQRLSALESQGQS